MKLPKLNNTQQLLRTYQVQFGGLNHTEGASDGDIYDMKNMASDHYPVLCPREKRKYLAKINNATGGMISYGGVIVFADGTELKMLKDGETTVVGEVSEGEKVFATFRDTVLIFPDKVSVNVNDGKLEELGVTLNLATAVFKAEGMLYGEAAENNTIYAPGITFGDYFKEGDAVEISGCLLEANNKTPIIREVDGNYLRFYENVFETKVDVYTYKATKTLSSAAGGQLTSAPCYGFVQDGNRVAFTLPQDAAANTLFEWQAGSDKVFAYFADEEGNVSDTATNIPMEPDATITTYLDFIGQYGDVTETNITLSRTIPDMDFLITDDNRLWGAKGHTIYGSKLGDPTNFNVFDGLSTDSYSVEVGNAGDITAVLTYGGYPTFFKEDGIYRLYGDRPSNYQLMPTMKQGVREGCAKSLAIAGEVLYYISRSGIMAYSGGIPTKADEALGMHIINGVAASDGQKYYISATEDGENYAIYVYDTSKGMWHKEDDLKLTYATYDKAVIALTEDGDLLALTYGVDTGAEEEDVEWAVEFADMTFGSPFQKGVVKANVRFELQPGAEAKAEIRYDGGEWELIREFTGDGKRSNVLPVIPHRCDHFRLKLSGRGICDIYSMALQYYNGSENY